jgi:truncated hemoglobin YjbI
MTTAQTPTWYEWAGGIERIKPLFKAFYERVPTDPILAPVFAHMAPALIGYLEWGSRLAVINSATADNPIGRDAPMPKWGWGEVKGPYSPG